MTRKYNTFFSVFIFLSLTFIFLNPAAHASPFGDGYYGALVPYGGSTSITISDSGNINIPISPTSGGTLNSATGTVTVVSTDVVGYDLYINALSNSNLTNSSTGSTIPASSNGSEAALATDTWGYNTDGTSNFVGISTSNTLVLAYSGPIESGNTTSFTYGVNVDNQVAPGSYAANVLYTAVPQTN